MQSLKNFLSLEVIFHGVRVCDAVIEDGTVGTDPCNTAILDVQILQIGDALGSYSLSGQNGLIF